MQNQQKHVEGKTYFHVFKFLTMVRALDSTLIHRTKMKGASSVSTCVLNTSRPSIFSTEYHPLLLETVYWYLRIAHMAHQVSTRFVIPSSDFLMA